MEAKWKCAKCGWEGDLPLIVPGMCGLTVVDIIDILCPNVGCSGDPVLIGTYEEKEKWWDDWDDWYEKKLRK